MRRLLFVALMCLLPQLALADCAEEARAARERAASAGPMHFERLSWNDDLTGRICGKVEPGRAEYKGPCTNDTMPAPESIAIGRQSWSNDGLGWRGPWLSSWSHQGTAPERAFAFQLRRISCLGAVRIDGVELKTYEFVLRSYDREYVETLFVEAASRLPVRYEQRPDGHRGVNYQTTYRHDPALMIDPPVVDPEKRRAVSMQRYSVAVAQSDPACRREVLGVIQRGAATAFEYSVQGAFWAGVWGMNGTFSPPRSLHHRIEGVPRHGGGSEVIAIGDDAWTMTPWDSWTSDHRAVALAEGELIQLAPSARVIGRVDCVGRITIDGQDYSVYDYDFYFDEDSARHRGGMRRVFVDVATGLPARIEHFTIVGPRTEIRRYDASLSVRAPNVSAPARPDAPVLPPTPPFDEFRRRLFEK